MKIHSPFKILIVIIASCLINNGHATSCVLSDSEVKPTFHKTMDTIGDSISWYWEGDRLRCLLRDKGLKYDFVGGNFDYYGFRHDAVNANTTLDVIKRLDTIAVADAYFLLIGTNDTMLTPQATVENIITITLALIAKNPAAKVYISTLLPRNDKFLQRNLEVNHMLLTLQNDGKWFKNCYVLNAGASFYWLPGWQKYLFDGVHLNHEAYDIFTGLIMESLKEGDK